MPLGPATAYATELSPLLPCARRGQGHTRDHLSYSSFLSAGNHRSRSTSLAASSLQPSHCSGAPFRPGLSLDRGRQLPQPPISLRPVLYIGRGAASGSLHWPQYFGSPRPVLYIGRCVSESRCARLFTLAAAQRAALYIGRGTQVLGCFVLSVIGVPPTYGSEYLQDGLTCVRKHRHFGDGTGFFTY